MPTRMIARILFTLLVLLSAALYAEEPGESSALSADHKITILELKNRMLEADAKYARAQAKINACDSETMASLNTEVASLQRGYAVDDAKLKELKAKIEAEYPNTTLDIVNLRLIKRPAPKATGKE